METTYQRELSRREEEGRRIGAGLFVWSNGASGVKLGFRAWWIGQIVTPKYRTAPRFLPLLAALFSSGHRAVPATFLHGTNVL